MSIPDVQKNSLLKDTAAYKLNTPEGLDVGVIQSIGTVYLEERKTASRTCFGFFDSLAHTNQPIALEFKKYNEENDYEKWMFLANCYGKLPNSNGKIANAIFTLFQLAFKEVPFAYRLIHPASSLDQTLDGEITTATLANALKITINNYFIKKFQNELCSQTEDQTYYGSTHLHSLKNNPDRLSNAIIQNIGIDYLHKYDPEKKGCLPSLNKLFHHNQPAALHLKKYSQASSAYEKWLFLAEAYAKLGESHGELSDAILNAFLMAFGQVPYTNKLHYSLSKYGDSSYHQYYEPATISIALKGLVNDFYANQYRTQLEMQCDKITMAF